MSLLALRAILNQQGASFDPTLVAGCQLWLDGYDAATFTYSSGVVVSQWADKSGVGNHVVQALTSKQPSRNAGGYISLDNTDVLKCTPASPFGAVAGAGLTIVTVFRKTGANNTYEALPAQLSYGNVGRPCEGYNAGRIVETNGVVPNTGSFANINTFTSWTCLTTKISISGGGRPTWREYTNGVLTCTGFEVALTSSSVNQRIVIGARDDETPQFTGDVAEVVMFDTPLGDSDREYVEAGVMSRRGI